MDHEDPTEYFFDVSCPGPDPSAAVATEFIEELTILVSRVAAGALLMWFSGAELATMVRKVITQREGKS